VDAKFWIDVWFDDDPPKQRRRQYRPQATKFALFFLFFYAKFARTTCSTAFSRDFIWFLVEKSPPRASSPRPKASDGVCAACCVFCKLAGVEAKFATPSCLTTISPGLFLIVGGEESTKSIVVKTNRKRRSLRCLMRFFYLAGVDAKFWIDVARLFLVLVEKSPPRVSSPRWTTSDRVCAVCWVCFFIWLEWRQSLRGRLVWWQSCETFFDFWWCRVHQERHRQDQPTASDWVCIFCCCCKFAGVDASNKMWRSGQAFFWFWWRRVLQERRKRWSLRCFLPLFFIRLEWTWSSRGWLDWQPSLEAFFGFGWEESTNWDWPQATEFALFVVFFPSAFLLPAFLLLT